MVDAIQISTSSLLSDMERMRLISQNLSNGSTPGYRAELSNGRMPTRFDDWLAAELTPSAAVTRLQLQGTIQPTQHSLDLAIQGDGYFEIETDHGIRYTRRGDFRLDEDSQLVTPAGDRVVAATGSLRLPSPEVSIDTQGVVRHAGNDVGTVSIVTFANDQDLVYEGEGLYRAQAVPSTALDWSRTRVQQGALEASNVQPMQQMTDLMQTVRHLGFSAQALRAYDQILDAAINDVAQN